MPFQGHLSSNHWNHDLSLIFSQIVHKNCPKMVSFMQVLLNIDTRMNNLHEKVDNCFSGDLKGHFKVI